MKVFACHMALSGDGQRALEKLKVAFQMNPSIVDWARQDTDLVSLHDNPEYQAMLESVNV